jgi:hypothetical protein
MNWKDIFSKAKVYIHGAVLAAGTAFTVAVEQIISSSGNMPSSGQLKGDAITALSVGALYLLKTLFLGSSVKQQ